MLPLEEYLRHVDELAQSVVNAWGVNVEAGHAADLTTEFKALLDRACRYQSFRRVADNHREFSMLTEQEAAEEKTAREAFAEAYKTFYEKHAALSSAQ